MNLSDIQIDALLQPIASARVSKKDGQSHVEAYDIRRRLTNIFGFAGWSEDTTELVMLYEQSKQDKDQTRWRAAYRATVRLQVAGATYTESAVGTNFGWLPDSKRDEAHDMAMKTAASQALKRCAINLGDQFGLSLYNKGSLAPLVVYVLGDRPAKWTPEGIVRPESAGPAEPAADTVDVQDHVTEQLAPESPAPGEGEATGYAGPSPVQDPESPVGEASKPPLTRIQAKDTHDAGEEQPGVPASPPPDQPDEPMPTPQDMLNDEVRAVLAHEDWSAQKKRGQLSKILLRAGQIPGVKTSLVVVGDEYVSLEARIQAAIMQVGR